MENNTLICISVKYTYMLAVRMYYNEIILSLENGESGRVKVKRDRSGHVVLYGESFEQLIDRYHLHHDYRMDFQNDGGNHFLVRIRDTQGVEIEYEMRMIDNSRWFQSKNKGTPASLCKMFGEEEVADAGSVSLVGDGSRWAIETRPFNDGTIRLFGAEFHKLVRHFGITHKCRAIFDYGDESSFYLRLVDMNWIEIGYEVADKINRKKDVIDEANRNAQSPLIQIRYYKGFLMGDTFGENGKPSFMKKITVAICIRMPPIGKPTVALMCIGDGEKVECNIRWGGGLGRSGELSYVCDSEVERVKVKPSTVICHVSFWFMNSNVDFVGRVPGAEIVPPGTENVVGCPDDLQQMPCPPAENFTKSYRLS
ncbi:hypothetical protein ACFE04_029237 [Oxalis oulophora]